MSGENSTEDLEPGFQAEYMLCFCVVCFLFVVNVFACWSLLCLCLSVGLVEQVNLSHSSVP